MHVHAPLHTARKFVFAPTAKCSFICSNASSLFAFENARNNRMALNKTEMITTGLEIFELLGFDSGSILL